MNTVSLLVKSCLITASAMVMALTLSVSKANATLIGDTVGCNTNNGACTTLLPVVGDGAEFLVLFGTPFLSVDIGASTIELSFNVPGSIGGTIINLTGLDWVGFPGGFITNAELTTNNGFIGLSAGDITFGDHNVSIVLNSIDFDEGASALITLTASHGVPEPASLAIFGFGLLGVGAMRRRRRAA